MDAVLRDFQLFGCVSRKRSKPFRNIQTHKKSLEIASLSKARLGNSFKNAGSAVGVALSECAPFTFAILKEPFSDLHFRKILTRASKGAPFRGKELENKERQEYHSCIVNWIGPKSDYFKKLKETGDSPILEIDIPGECG